MIRGYVTFAMITVGLVGGLFSCGSRTRTAAAEPQGPAVQVTRAANAPAEVRLRRSERGHFYVHAMVNGQLVRFMVDTGATHVVLTETDAERVGISLKDLPRRVIGTGASGAVHGRTSRLDSVAFEGRQVSNLDVMIAEGLDVSLLGQDYLTRIGTMTMAGDAMVLR